MRMIVVLAAAVTMAACRVVNPGPEPTRSLEETYREIGDTLRCVVEVPDGWWVEDEVARHFPGLGVVVGAELGGTDVNWGEPVTYWRVTIAKDAKWRPASTRADGIPSIAAGERDR